MKEDTKHPLLMSILFFTFSLMFIFFFITSLNDLNASKTTNYNDLIYGEFTVESIREITDSETSTMYYIDVLEEEKNIRINNLLTNKKVSDGILSLKSGDRIYCYFTSNSSYYEIVQLKTDNSTILSLDDYKEIYNRQGTIGIVISPFMFIIMFGIAVKALFLFHMQKKKITI